MNEISGRTIKDMADINDIGKLQEYLVQASNIEKEKMRYESSISKAYSRYLDELNQIYNAMISEKDSISFALKLIGKDVEMENAAENYKNLINSIRPNTVYKQ